VEHPVTEALYQDLDIVELMLKQALQERLHDRGIDGVSPTLDQAHYNSRRLERHAIEARLYAENPSENFRPCPGVLQHVTLGLGYEWARVENWVRVFITL
jgi:urea carboxylase